MHSEPVQNLSTIEVPGDANGLGVIGAGHLPQGRGGRIQTMELSRVMDRCTAVRIAVDEENRRGEGTISHQRTDAWLNPESLDQDGSSHGKPYAVKPSNPPSGE
jgi:hypothetical protein